MSEGSTVDAWLSQWEDLRGRGQAMPAEEFLARHCPDATPELADCFLSMARRLDSVDGHLQGTWQQATPAGQSDTGGEPSKPLCLAPGMELDGYHLVRPINRGGFGEVWEAEGRGGFRVALKLVPLGGQAGAIETTALERLRGPAAPSGLRHAHVLPIFAAWQQDGWLVIACELADRTLADRLRECKQQGNKGIPVPELLRHLQEAAEGLDFLNKADIQHRDVKPPNLLLVGGAVKVGDLGLVKHVQGTHASHTGSMTMAYAAPEMLGGRLTHYSDQYSLAVTYCELRGGRLPFTGTYVDLLKGHLEGEPDLSMLDELERPVVARALAKQPNLRWPSCTQLAKELAAALDGCSVVTVEGQVVPPGESPQAGELRPHDDNLRRWLASGEPRFWVQDRNACWDEADLSSLLARLERSKFWPLEPACVQELLEDLQRTWRPVGQCRTNELGMAFAWIPPGRFVMGSPEDEAGRDPDELRHPVTLTRGFWLGVTQVTQQQFQSVLGFNPSHFKGGDLPVETVHWETAMDFCRRLSETEGCCYRLPTEAEWEYACRAGSETAYWFGNDSHGPNPFLPFIRLFGEDILARHAWYGGNSGWRTHPCGELPANPWGLHDMHGNVWEWCLDWYDVDYYKRTPLIDPPGPETGTRHVLRGGSWANKAIRLRSARRPWLPPEHPDRYGFRVLMEADDRWGQNE